MADQLAVKTSLDKVTETESCKHLSPQLPRICFITMPLLHLRTKIYGSLRRQMWNIYWDTCSFVRAIMSSWINPINKTDGWQDIARHNLCFLEYDINNTQMFNDMMSKFSHEKSQGCRLNWPSVQPAMKEIVHHFSQRIVQVLMSQGYKSFPNQWMKNEKHIFF